MPCPVLQRALTPFGNMCSRPCSQLQPGDMDAGFRPTGCGGGGGGGTQVDWNNVESWRVCLSQLGLGLCMLRVGAMIPRLQHRSMLRQCFPVLPIGQDPSTRRVGGPADGRFGNRLGHHWAFQRVLETRAHLLPGPIVSQMPADRGHMCVRRLPLRRTRCAPPATPIPNMLDILFPPELQEELGYFRRVERRQQHTKTALPLYKQER